jgi:hypothetical protein
MCQGALRPPVSPAELFDCTIRQLMEAGAMVATSPGVSPSETLATDDQLKGKRKPLSEEDARENLSLGQLWIRYDNTRWRRVVEAESLTTRQSCASESHHRSGPLPTQLQSPRP